MRTSYFLAAILFATIGAPMVEAQQVIGYLERFALAKDRSEALQELIPGTQDFFYFHCLHFQNSGELAKSEAMLKEWKGRLGEGGSFKDMQLRQMLLEYSSNPAGSTAYLTRELAVNLAHPAPKQDQAAELASQLLQEKIDRSAALQRSIQQEKSLGGIESAALVELLDDRLEPQQLRELIRRLPRADASQVVTRVAEELSMKDSKGFGWARVHQNLTRAQLDELLTKLPRLADNAKFNEEVARRLQRPRGLPLSDPAVMREYLLDLYSWSRKLPASQNDIKALVLGNLLKSDFQNGTPEVDRFIEYLKLPRKVGYLKQPTIQSRRLVNLNFQFPAISLPPVGNDEALVRNYVEYFVRNQQVERFANLFEQEYLERIVAETSILYGIGESKTWYSKLDSQAQRKLRERVELRFAATNKSKYQVDEQVQLELDLKNVDKLIVKIFAIDTGNYYRSKSQQITEAIDLDGLVPQESKTFTYAQSADRRHQESITLPELAGRGVWVVDLLGGGQRSRALIRKGGLALLSKSTSVGQLVRVVREDGTLVRDASLEINGQDYEAEESGWIQLPFAEEKFSRNAILHDADFADMRPLIHRGEEYSISCNFLIDPQTIVAGTQATCLIRSRLKLNGEPIPLANLKDVHLKLTASDIDGVSTSKDYSDLELSDGSDFELQFLVPQRVQTLKFELSAEIEHFSSGTRKTLQASYDVAVNGIQTSSQIADYFLSPSTEGFQLRVLGRNGEPITRAPVQLSFKLRGLVKPILETLATDASGTIDLGQLSDVEQVSVESPGIGVGSFALDSVILEWPRVIHSKFGDEVSLPIGQDKVDASDLSLVSLLGDRQLRNEHDAIKIENGLIKVSGLAAGRYQLSNHLNSVATVLVVGDAQALASTPTSTTTYNHALIELSRRSGLVIQKAELTNDSLIIKIHGADENSRVHFVAHPFLPRSRRRLGFDDVPLKQSGLPVETSRFQDSLKLDEEYQYILDRQSAAKYPGSLLKRPSVLLHPWEISVTENQVQNAAAGDAFGAPAPAAKAEAESIDGKRGRGRSQQQRRQLSPSYEFLQVGSTVVANLSVPDSGELVVPLEKLEGFSCVEVQAIHPERLDRRLISLPRTKLRTKDNRLKSSFENKVHLAKLQNAEVLKAGETLKLGDPRSQDVQTFRSLKDVFQLYSTLLRDKEFDKFRFLCEWSSLSLEQKKSHYNEMACHELNFFLYHKDPQFFQAVVRPFIENKLAKQLFDQWLLGKPLDEFQQLWRVEQLNTLERVLLALSADQGQERKESLERWLSDYIEANPSSTNNIAVASAMMADGLELTDLSIVQSAPQMPQVQLGIRESLGAVGGRSRAAKSANVFFGVPGGGGGMELGRRALFRSLEATREWVETNYYRVRLSDQAAARIGPNNFWREYLKGDGKLFLSSYLVEPCENLSEAICALAVIDLPFEAEGPTVDVTDGELVVSGGKANALVLIEGVSEVETGADQELLVAFDIFSKQPGTSQSAQNASLRSKDLLVGVPYESLAVVTNPTNQQLQVSVLSQLPSGAIGLEKTKLVSSQPIVLRPYSTTQVRQSFYFPEAGEFDAYGIQVNSEDESVASTQGSQLRVLNEPAESDTTTWSYVADWGSNKEVQEFLATANLQQLDLSRIAFRMSDAEFFEEICAALSSAGYFHKELWGYAFMHANKQRIQQYLQHRADVIARVGIEFDSEILKVQPAARMNYEHIDYSPLVNARAHQLGKQRVVLNPSLHAQYNRFLDLLAHTDSLTAETRLQASYYLLLQNRIDEALEFFRDIDRKELATKLQYDYFDAYLSLRVKDYERAEKIAREYEGYPVPRWQRLFEQVSLQLAERRAILSGGQVEQFAVNSAKDSDQQLLTNERDAKQTKAADQEPSLVLEIRDGAPRIEYRNLQQVTVNYYLMDIELLFSRNPFVGTSNRSVPVVRPNLSQVLNVDEALRSQVLQLPAGLENRNVVIEVKSQGISRSVVLTANSLRMELLEQYGQLRVQSSQEQRPLESVYVKVYAKHRDGSVRFYKDGYTDLRGYFDYATLSTDELDTATKFALLVIDDELGAIVAEANLPTR